METGNMDTRFCPAAVQGALPRLAIIIKLFPKAFNVMEQINHSKFTGIPLIMTSAFLQYFVSFIAKYTAKKASCVKKSIQLLLLSFQHNDNVRAFLSLTLFIFTELIYLPCHKLQDIHSRELGSDVNWYIRYI